MREIKKNLEQLEEARLQLGKDTPTGARLALLLIDNLIELVMFKRVQCIFAHDEYYENISPAKPASPRHSSNKRKKVREHFDDKVNFLCRETRYQPEGEMDDDEGLVLKISHKFRNEAYHKGVLRDGIIIPVTKVYLEIVCRLVPRLWSGSYGYAVGEVRAFLQRYDMEQDYMDKETLANICRRLLSGMTCEVRELCDTLSKELSQRIDAVVEGLDYLIRDAHVGKSQDDVLKLFQCAEKFYETYDGPRVFQTQEGFLRFNQERDEFFRTFEPPVTMGRLERWRQRAAELQSTARPGAAMDKFWHLDGERRGTEELVEEAIAEFEAKQE